MSRLLSKLFAAAAVAAVAAAGDARAAVITQGDLVVNVRDDNGAINNLTFGGVEYYRVGAFVSDYGFQTGTNTGTFRLLDTFGGEPAGVTAGVTSSTASSVTVTGTYTAGGANVGFTRVYDFGGADVLRTTTTLTNLGTAAVNLRYFDTFDPDQGNGGPGVPNVGLSTINDVFTLAGVTVGQATAPAANNRSVVYGTADAIGFGEAGATFQFGLGIASGTQLNAFFTNPLDPNGVGLADTGVGIGFDLNLAAGQTTTVSFLQAYGVSAAAAQAAFIAASTPTAAIPEPASMTLAAVGMAGLVGIRIRRRKAEAAA